MSLVKPTVYDLILPLLQVALIIAKWSGLDVPWFWILLPLWGVCCGPGHPDCVPVYHLFGLLCNSGMETGEAMSKSEFAQSIARKTREKLQLSQEEMAQLLGVHPITVSKWELGKSAPSPWQLAIMVKMQEARSSGECSTALCLLGPVHVLAKLLNDRL